YRGDQWTTGTPARLGPRVPQPHQLHRTIAPRGRRIPTPPTPWIRMSLFGVGAFPWLRGGPLTLVVFAVIQMTKNVGINVIIVLASLQAVPGELLEAARIDGAGAWRSEEHTSELQSRFDLVWRLLRDKTKRDEWWRYGG